jgi:hypothetical protein
MIGLCPCISGKATKLHIVGTHRMFVNMNLAKDWLRLKACVGNSQPVFLVASFCYIILSLFGGTAWVEFFQVCVLIINTLSLEVKFIQEQS